MRKAKAPSSVGSGMRRGAATAAAIGLVLGLIGPGATVGHTRRLRPLGTPGSAPMLADAATATQPSDIPASELQSAEDAARSYWGGWPACGRPIVRVRSFPAAIGGQAVPPSCWIFINDSVPWMAAGDGTWGDLCIAMVHEWGHLMLGYFYFSAVNPSDPSHSPDPTSIMNATNAVYNLAITPCEGMGASGTVTPAARPAVPLDRRSAASRILKRRRREELHGRRHRANKTRGGHPRGTAWPIAVPHVREPGVR